MVFTQMPLISPAVEEKIREEKAEKYERKRETWFSVLFDHESSPRKNRPYLKDVSVLSMGGGVQTHAALFMEPERYTHVVMADPGSEWPLTYEYLRKYTIPFCKDHGINFTLVQAEIKLEKMLGKEYPEDSSDFITVRTLEQFCRELGILPSRKDRWCTEMFKIVPIRQFLSMSGYSLPVKCAIGFSMDEIHRMKVRDHPEYGVFYPLLDKKMTRNDCIDLIKKKGFPVPPKSGCYFCPMNKLKMWHRLYIDHRELFINSKSMEQSSVSYPHYILSGNDQTLERLAIRFGEGCMKLDGWMELQKEMEQEEAMVDMSCDSGTCMH